MEEYIIEIILAVIGVTTTIIGGSWYIKNKSNRRSNDVKQKNIHIQGNDNKVVGGDDKSKSNVRR